MISLPVRCAVFMLPTTSSEDEVTSMTLLRSDDVEEVNSLIEADEGKAERLDAAGAAFEDEEDSREDLEKSERCLVPLLCTVTIVESELVGPVASCE